jgi:hypothetical protein
VRKKTALPAKMVSSDGLWVLQDVLFCALAFHFFYAAKISLIFFVSFFGLLVTFCSYKKLAISKHKPFNLH